MMNFFAEVKKYSLKLVEMILLVLTSSSTDPSSSAPPARDSAPSEVSSTSACLFFR
jgi:hypothetical protein